MSDTPRTDDNELGYGKVTTDFARQLERELNAANDRMKQLEEAKAEIVRLNCRINRIKSMYAAKDDQICNLLEICRANGIEISSQDLINWRTSK